MPSVARRICAREGDAGFERREGSESAGRICPRLAVRGEPRTAMTSPLTIPGTYGQSWKCLQFLQECLMLEILLFYLSLFGHGS